MHNTFVQYFSRLKVLSWVERTGKEEPSSIQENYPPSPPRRFYRLTKEGREAGDVLWSNPLFTIYGEEYREAVRAARKKRKYIRVSR